MPSLKGSGTGENLKDAVAGKPPANRRHLHLVQKAEAGGGRDVATMAAAADSSSADSSPVDSSPVDSTIGGSLGKTADNLAAAITTVIGEHIAMYPGMARTAREEGFEEIADWFATLAKAGRSHARRFRRLLDNLQ